MRSSRSLLLAAMCCMGLMLVMPSDSHGIILYGHDNSTNLTDPGVGLPWQNVGRIENSSSQIVGTGVYLDNQFVLTANHVGPVFQVVINGNTFTVDTSFNSGGFVNGQMQIGSADLKLVRLTSTPTGMATVNLNTSSALDRNRSSYAVGYGVGKGTEVPGEGWNWGAADTSDKRWGTNVTLNTVYDVSGTTAIATRFDDTSNPNESALTLYDSGSALFYEHSGQWYLSGIGFTVDVGNSSYYNRSGSGDRSFYARVAAYQSDIDIALAIPEPPAYILLGGGLICLWWLRRRRKQQEVIAALT